MTSNYKANLLQTFCEWLLATHQFMCDCDCLSTFSFQSHPLFWHLNPIFISFSIKQNAESDYFRSFRHYYPRPWSLGVKFRCWRCPGAGSRFSHWDSRHLCMPWLLRKETHRNAILKLKLFKKLRETLKTSCDRYPWLSA